MSDNPIFKINKHMIATPRLETLHQDAQEGNTIVGISTNAVVRRDLITLEMAADANQQPGRRVDAFDEILGDKFGGEA